MNTLTQKARQKAESLMEEVNKIQPISQPKSLDQIKLLRMDEKELEKHAPSTGYPPLDSIVKGFVPGHLYTVTGIENVGKTSLACNFAVRVAAQGKRVLYIALEPENTVIDYIASVFHDKRFDDLTEEDLDMMDLPIHILGKEDIPSTERMVETIETLDRYDLVIIDHIGYFITSQTNHLQQQANSVKQLVSIAKKKRCAIMIIAHLRKRDKHTKKQYVPSSDDISGSAAFKQDSTEVMIVTRNFETEEDDSVTYSDIGKLYVTKTKAGPNGSIPLVFSEKKANIKTRIWEDPDPRI